MIVLARRIIFFLSNMSAAKPATAINKKPGTVKETITPETPKFDPVSANTETTRANIKNAEANCPIKIIDVKRKKSLSLSTER